MADDVDAFRNVRREMFTNAIEVGLLYISLVSSQYCVFHNRFFILLRNTIAITFLIFHLLLIH